MPYGPVFVSLHASVGRCRPRYRAEKVEEQRNIPSAALRRGSAALGWGWIGSLRHRGAAFPSSVESWQIIGQALPLFSYLQYFVQEQGRLLRDRKPRLLLGDG